MKNKFLVLSLVVLVAMLAVPTSAFAWSGVKGEVRDSLTGGLWGWGGTVWVINESAGGTLVGEGDIVGGLINITYESGKEPAFNDLITVYIYPNPQPAGSPGMLTRSYTEVPEITVQYDFGNVMTNTGPNALELVDFSVASQSPSNTWLPLVLLVGSVALVSGAITVIRKRKA